MDYALLEESCKCSGSFYERNHSLAEHTSMKIGGACDILARPVSEAALADMINVCRRGGIPYFILGRGSNVLISGNGWRGAVLLIGRELGGIAVDGEYVVVGAGAGLAQVCMAAADAGLGGMEFAYGIPGSVGGALYMNAGAYGGEMSDVTESCRYIGEDGEIHEMAAADMKLRYRGSIFSESRLCILSVRLKLFPKNTEAIRARMDELMQKRREKQPLEYPSCGSTFKRPDGYFAAALIEECGLKGYAIGGAQVSEKHSGFVINRGGASFDDVMRLVEHIKRTVKEKKGIELECEMLILE